MIIQTYEKKLDVPDLLDDYYLNLLDWGSSNVIAIALGSTVCLWDASHGSASELVSIDDENGPVTSVNWAPDGRHIAIGLANTEVQLWDSASQRKVYFELQNYYTVLKQNEDDNNYRYIFC